MRWLRNVHWLLDNIESRGKRTFVKIYHCLSKNIDAVNICQIEVRQPFVRHVSNMADTQNDGTPMPVLIQTIIEMRWRFASTQQGKSCGQRVPQASQSLQLATRNKWVLEWRALLRFRVFRYKATTAPAVKYFEVMFVTLHIDGNADYNAHRYILAVCSRATKSNGQVLHQSDKTAKAKL